MNCALTAVIRPLGVFVLAALPMMGADARPGARQIFDKQLIAAERDVMELTGRHACEQIQLRPRGRCL